MKITAPITLTAAAAAVQTAEGNDSHSNVAIRMLESAFAGSNEAASYDMADAKGHKYRCTATKDQKAGTEDGGLAALHKALDGRCFQYFPGSYWAYEWCYHRHVSQFHFVPPAQRDPEWSLGSYSKTLLEYVEMGEQESSKIASASSGGSSGGSGSSSSGSSSGGGGRRSRSSQNDKLEEETGRKDRSGTMSAVSNVAGAAAKLAKGSKALRGLHESYTKGQHCDETEGPRSTIVRYSCCETAQAADDAPPAQILGLRESDLCAYTLEVCSPFLCGLGLSETTVLQLLDQGPECLPIWQEGWWSYEFCHRNLVRQIHITQRLDEGGKPVTEVDAEFILGRFDEEAAQLTLASSSSINQDLSDGGSSSNAAASSGRTGTAGVREIALEYTGGTPCDVPPAGTIPRSVTVLFRCDMAKAGIKSFREDTTCHYEMVVISPLLCRHPALRPQQQATRTVVCTQLNDAEVSQHGSDENAAAGGEGIVVRELRAVDAGDGSN